MLRMLLLAIALLAAGCGRSTTWFLESDDAGTIKLRQNGMIYTAVCQTRFDKAMRVIHQGASVCEIPSGLEGFVGKSIPIELRDRDSSGNVVVTTLTILEPQPGPHGTGSHFGGLLLHQFMEGNPSGGFYETFGIIPPLYRPGPEPFIRPVYITEDA